MASYMLTPGLLLLFCLTGLTSSGESSRLLDLLDKVIHEEHGLDSKKSQSVVKPVYKYTRYFDNSAVDVADAGLTALVKNDLQEPPLKIAAFNIQIFGDRKYGKEEIVYYLLKILQRYDLILVQEIRDINSDSFFQLTDDLNRASGDQYEYVISDRLGRSSSKEQYAYIYKKEYLQLSKVFQYKDRDDVFERPPFSALFQSPKTEVAEFGVVGIHTKPSEAVAEIDGLSKVLDTVQDDFRTDNIIIMGDFNADCSYVNGMDWSKIELRLNPSLSWPIPDDYDTTIAVSVCAYDRFVISGEELKLNIVPNSAKIFNFTKEYQLTHQTAMKISDHYPIEMELFGKVNPDMKQSISTSLCFSVESQEPVTDEGGLDILLSIADPAETGGFDIETLHGENNNPKYITATKTNLNIWDIMPSLWAYHEAHKTLLSNHVISVAQAYLEDAKIFQNVKSIPGFPATKYPNYNIQIEYRYTAPKTYKLTLSGTMS